jgi:hypothetical protein
VTSTLGPSAYSIDGFFELGHGNGFIVATGGQNRRLVEHIGQVSPGKAGRLPRQRRQCDVGLEGLATRVHDQDSLSSAYIWRRHGHDPIEATRPQQGRIEHIGTVPGGDDDDPGVVGEAIHFDQDLVEGLLTFVISVSQSGTALTANCVNFVDKDNARGTFVGFVEEMADTTRATPTNISTNSDPEILKKGTPASRATARASSVLPVPGGPISSTPRGMRAPSSTNF